MKAHWLKSAAVCFTFGLVCHSTSVLAISQEKALSIARQSKEAQLFHELLSDQYQGCIQGTPIPSCDSDWVTCIDDGWVVQFMVKEECSIDHDGRFLLMLVLDKDGGIISRFPEAEYFQQASYCLEDYDCLQREGECVNFIFASFLKPLKEQGQECVCREQKCQMGT